MCNVLSYNPNKPNKFGIKLYTLCESSSGYCLAFDVYTAQPSPLLNLAEDVGMSADSNATEKIVVGLLENAKCLGLGHHVYMDNYYTSTNLFDFLVANKTYACGTVRSSRKGLPTAFSEIKNLKNQECITRTKNQLMALKFQDKRTVHMLSTIHDSTGKIVQKPKRPAKMKPDAVTDYCSKMRGVDLMDQVSQYYEITRRSMKWWRKLAFYMIDLCTVNAYQLYKKFSNNRKKLHTQNSD